ncbi:Alpha/beta hydrolase family protein [Brevundimonas sp. SH203]|uniref:alpha/beta hydrolase family protein n=1 Tax=Brevundimonas sp. SH203 TaxID=345167 RepID=UPI0009CB069B|nr:dienelactone hydrolase [Brevundimonas sp. SH203]GAW41290.1 Alpha/beta hydrolase family protein [Brevundimonas sp. SH203]
MTHPSAPLRVIAGLTLTLTLALTLALPLPAGAASPVHATPSQAQGPARAPADRLAPDQVFTFPGGPDGAVEAGVWLPARPADGRPAPLVVFSHGNAGGFRGHADTARALADAGFVVAALTHPGDNYRDTRRSTQLTARAPQLSRLIDYMVGEGAMRPGAVPVDPDRIGAFGFSAGGFTVTSAIGGVSDAAAIGAHCLAHPAVFACRLLDAKGIDLSTWRPRTRDGRIKAAVIAAPALGFSFTSDSLAAIRIPVQLWQAGADATLPAPDNVEPIRDRLGRAPEYHRVTGAGHYDFMPPCSPGLAAAAPQICAPTPGFDRAAFHRDFNREVVRFFRETLQEPQSRSNAPAPPAPGRTPPPRE